jgi:hypothetical protein
MGEGRVITIWGGQLTASVWIEMSRMDGNIDILILGNSPGRFINCLGASLYMLFGPIDFFHQLYVFCRHHGRPADCILHHPLDTGYCCTIK